MHDDHVRGGVGRLGGAAWFAAGADDDATAPPSMPPLGVSRRDGSTTQGVDASITDASPPLLQALVDRPEAGAALGEAHDAHGVLVGDDRDAMEAFRRFLTEAFVARATQRLQTDATHLRERVIAIVDHAVVQAEGDAERLVDTHAPLFAGRDAAATMVLVRIAALLGLHADLDAGVALAHASVPRSGLAREAASVNATDSSAFTSADAVLDAIQSGRWPPMVALVGDEGAFAFAGGVADGAMAESIEHLALGAVVIAAAARGAVAEPEQLAAGWPAALGPQVRRGLGQVVHIAATWRDAHDYASGRWFATHLARFVRAARDPTPPPAARSTAQALRAVLAGDVRSLRALRDAGFAGAPASMHAGPRQAVHTGPRRRTDVPLARLRGPARRDEPRTPGSATWPPDPAEPPMRPTAPKHPSAVREDTATPVEARRCAARLDDDSVSIDEAVLISLGRDAAAGLRAAYRAALIARFAPARVPGMYFGSLDEVATYRAAICAVLAPDAPARRHAIDARIGAWLAAHAEGERTSSGTLTALARALEDEAFVSALRSA